MPVIFLFSVMDLKKKTKDIIKFAPHSYQYVQESTVMLVKCSDIFQIHILVLLIT
jgi:hypothetical protein